MGVNVSLDVFQEKMANLMEGLELIHTYLDDLLLIYNATFEEHLSQLITVLRRLRRAGVKINAEKSFFFVPEIEYLGYMLTKEGEASAKEDPSSTGSTTLYYSQIVEKFVRYGTVLQKHVEA